MKSFKGYIEEKGKGLWHNIHQKRKSGKPMRKKGEKGAPTAAAMAKAKGEANESTKAYGDTLRKIANDRKLKSLSKKDKDTLAKIADMLSKANEEVSLDEAPYVASDMNIVDSLWNEIRDKMFKDKQAKRFEKHWPFLQVLAKYAGFKITKKGQDKNKIFRYEIK